MGIFSDIMKMEISDNPNMSYAEFRAKAQKAVDSVDNRMGQLVYDNLMINRGMKDLGMASVQSLGWNIGTIRELVGGHVDLIKSLNDLRKGKPTELSYRTAYLMAMPLVVGYYGMIYQYLHTGLLPGQGHEEEGFAGRIKDFFNPRNGGIDKNGQESRTVLASYMKDVFAFTSNAPRTVVNKLNPLNSMLIEMWQNKDYYGTQIRNDDDGYVQQAIDVAKFIGTGYLPYSFTNQARDTRTGLEARLEPFFGMTPARYDVNMTEAEKTAYELGKSSYEGKTRTKEQAQHSKDRAKLRSQYMADKDEGPLQEAVKDPTKDRTSPAPPSLFKPWRHSAPCAYRAPFPWPAAPGSAVRRCPKCRARSSVAPCPWKSPACPSRRGQNRPRMRRRCTWACPWPPSVCMSHPQRAELPQAMMGCPEVP